MVFRAAEKVSQKSVLVEEVRLVGCLGLRRLVEEIFLVAQLMPSVKRIKGTQGWLKIVALIFSYKASVANTFCFAYIQRSPEIDKPKKQSVLVCK